MRDTLEQQLSARLREIGASVPDELEPPADLEARVRRRGQKASRLVRRSVLAVAAAVVVGATIVSVVARDPAPKVGVSGGGRPAAVARLDRTVMLDARGPYVVALDAGGHQIETLVTARRGAVVDAHLTSDHRTLWYLSVAGEPGTDCGEVVRADVASGTSQIFAHAVAFGISADGARLALAGAGDLAHGQCAPTQPPAGARLVVRDLVRGDVSTNALPVAPTAIAWAPAGDRIVTSACRTSCEALRAFDVPERLGAPLRARVLDSAGFASFGPDGLYVVASPVVRRLDVVTLRHDATVLTDESRDLLQVVPTATGTYVVARAAGAPDREPPGLLLIEHGTPRAVREPFAFGTLTAVPGPS